MSYPYTLDIMLGSEGASAGFSFPISFSGTPVKKPYSIINALIAQAPVGGSKIIQALSPQLDSEKSLGYTFTQTSGDIEGTINKFIYEWSGEGDNNILTIHISLTTPSDLYQITESTIKDIVIQNITSAEKESIDSVLTTSTDEVSIDLQTHLVTIDNKGVTSLQALVLAYTSSSTINLSFSTTRVLREYVPMGNGMLVFGVLTADTELDPTGIDNIINALLNNEQEGYTLHCSIEAFIISSDSVEYTQPILTEASAAGMQEGDSLAFLEYMQYLFDIDNVITDPSSMNDPSDLPEEGAIVDMGDSKMVYLGTKLHEFCASSNNNLSKAESDYAREKKNFPSVG